MILKKRRNVAYLCVNEFTNVYRIPDQKSQNLLFQIFQILRNRMGKLFFCFHKKIANTNRMRDF